MAPHVRAALSAANQGRKLTEEHKAKIGRAGTGRNHRAATIALLRTIKTGLRHSPETREKISQVQLGKKRSSEHRKKISQSLRGRQTSRETRQKLSLARRGRTLDETWRAHLSESHKGLEQKPESREKRRQAMIGQNMKVTAEKIALARAMFASGAKLKEVAEALGVSVSTASNIKNNRQAGYDLLGDQGEESYALDPAPQGVSLRDPIPPAGDPPFEAEDFRAANLVQGGFAQYVTPVPVPEIHQAVNPAQEQAEKAVTRKMSPRKRDS